MSILIVGGAGYIGSHYAHALVDRGDDVIVLDDLSTGKEALLPRGTTFIRGDLGDVELVGRIIKEFNIDILANFAAKIIVEESFIQSLEYYNINTIKAHSLISVAIQNGVRNFIFSSTAAVYGNGDGSPISEAAALDPMSPYGRSKLAAEWILRDATTIADISFVIFRYFNVAGADPYHRTGQASPNATHLIKLAIATALGLRPNLTIFGTDYPTPDGTCIRDYIHVSDLADAHVLATDYLRAGGDSVILNCAYGHGSSVLEVVDCVKRVTGVDFPILFSGRRNGDPVSLVANGSAIRSKLGWHPKFADLDTIIRHAFAWEQKQLENG